MLSNIWFYSLIHLFIHIFQVLSVEQLKVYLIKFIPTVVTYWAIREKIQTGESWGLSKFQGSIKNDMGFLGRFKKNHVEFPWNGSWFLTLEFLLGVKQFCKISRGQSLYFPEFLRIREHQQKPSSHLADSGC